MSTPLSIRLQVLIVVSGLCAFLVAMCGLGIVDTQHSADGQTRLFAVLCGVGLLFAAIAGPLLVRSIVRPLKTAEQTAARIAAGNLSIDVPSGGSAEVDRVLAALAEMQTSLRRTVTDVRGAADGVAAVAAQISSGNDHLADRTEMQASSLQTATSSTQQLTVAVEQNGGAARQADTLAQQASEAATRGGEKVSQVVVSINAIELGTGRMAEITDVIDGIAFQTNILALNAAVEAARAGDKGRGFAVVAAEVRALAKRSAEAAKEIAALIRSSVSEVREGVSLAHETGATIADVVSQVKRLSECVADITIANAEQAGGIRQVNAAMTLLDQMRQQNEALVADGAAAAQSLRAQAARLADAVAEFRLGGTAGSAPASSRWAT
jgi:methyl-accepting chemotaxis protein